MKRRRAVLRLIVAYLALWGALSDCRALMRGSDENTRSESRYPESRYPAVERYIQGTQKW